MSTLLRFNRRVPREQLAPLANDVARKLRYAGAPVLSAESPRDELVRWLQWADPNGVHLDELAETEGVEPLQGRCAI